MTTRTPQRSDFRFIHRLRVRWAEVDMQKIVFNPHYAMYLDTAMAEYWRALALPYESAMHQLGGDVFLKKMELDYHASARYDDVLEVGLRCQRLGNSSMVFEGAVLREHRPLVTAHLVYVYADAATQRPQPVPAPLRAIMEGFDAGQAMTECVVGSWDTVAAQASAVREAVFVQEQGIGAHMVWDGADAQAVHALVRNRLGQPLGTGRLVSQAPGVGRIGRMAVHRALRGSQVGREVLDALVQASRDRGDHEVMLMAQASAVGFYLRCGFAPRGAPFEEAGIAHQEMALTLRSET